MLTGVLLGIGAGLALATAALSLWTMARARRDLSELQPSVRADGRSATWTILTCGLVFFVLAAGGDPGDPKPLRIWLCVDTSLEPNQWDPVLEVLSESPVGVILVAEKAAIACPPTLDHDAVRDTIARLVDIPTSSPPWESAIDLVATRPGPAVCLLMPSAREIKLPPRHPDIVVASIDPAQTEDDRMRVIQGLFSQAEARRPFDLAAPLVKVRPWLAGLALVSGLGLWWRQA